MAPRPRKNQRPVARSQKDEQTEQTPAPKPGDEGRPVHPGAPEEAAGQRQEGDAQQPAAGPAPGTPAAAAGYGPTPKPGVGGAGSSPTGQPPAQQYNQKADPTQPDPSQEAEGNPNQRGSQSAVEPDPGRTPVTTNERPSAPPGTVRAAKPGEERDPELGALTMPDEGDFDQELTTQFDWLGNPPDLWWDQKQVIERPDRDFHKRVTEALGRDGRMRAVEAAVTLPLRQATPKLEPPGDDVGQTEFCNEALLAPVESGGMRTPLAQFIGQVANALVIRRTFHEKVFTRRADGMIVYKKLAWRPAESCEIWRDPRSAEILGFRQYQYLDEKGNPITQSEKTPADEFDKHDPTYRTVRAPYAFIYTHGKHRDPLHGISDLDVALWAHEMKLKVIALWQAFLDGQATPRMAVYGKDKGEVDKRARAMARLRGGGVAGFIRQGEDPVFDAIETTGTGSQAFQEFMRWLDNVQSESVMAGHLGLTGGATEGRGSLALSQDASGLYQASRDGVGKELGDAITADIVAPLVALNFGVGTSVPRFTFESMDPAKMDVIMKMFETFATAGSTNIPKEFTGVLLELVAQHLDLPADRIEKMIADQEQSIADGRALAAEMAGRDPKEEPGASGSGAERPAAGPGSAVGDTVDAAAALVGKAM